MNCKFNSLSDIVACETYYQIEENFTTPHSYQWKECSCYQIYGELTRKIILKFFIFFLPIENFSYQNIIATKPFFGSLVYSHLWFHLDNLKKPFIWQFLILDISKKKIFFVI